MDPSWLALVGFLLVAVVVATVMLWPRFRDAMGAQDPVVPEVLDALTRGLEEQDLAPELLQELRRDPLAVRRERDRWRGLLEGQGASQDVLRALDAL